MKNPELAVRALCLLFLAAVPGLPSLGHPTIDLRKLEMQVHRAINQERARHRIPSLEWNEILAAEARRHATNMVRYRFFAHEDPRRGDIAQRLDRSGVKWHRCAENLYEQRGDRDNLVLGAIKAWMNSAGHRRNILDKKLLKAGVGVAVRADGTVYIVQNFILEKLE